MPAARVIGPILAISLLAVPSDASAVPLTIGFEEPRPQSPRTSVKLEEYREGGFVFAEPQPPLDGSNGMGRTGAGSRLFPDNGTSHLDFLVNAALVFGTSAGSTFSLVAMDLAEYSVVFPVPKEIPVVGEREDGTTVQVLFTTDGQIDGSDPLVDFETFFLPASFHDLVEVRVATDLFAIDNVVVEVPEAASLLNIGLALAILGLVGRRQACTTDVVAPLIR